MTRASHSKVHFYIAGITFVVTLILLAVMIVRAEALVRLNIFGNLWFIILLIIGFTASVALFALFKSRAEYERKTPNEKLTLGGPAVLMLCVVVLGITTAPHPLTRFELTIFLDSENGQGSIPFEKEDALLLELGGDRRGKKVAPDGEVKFSGIPSDWYGKTVPVILKADRFELTPESTTVKLDTESKHLAVRPKMEQLRVIVINEKGHPLPNARIRISDKSAVTDEDGQAGFSMPSNLPEHELTATITLSGYKTWHGRATLGSNPLKVILEKEE